MMGKTLVLGIALVLIGCGDSGEPIEGTITIGYGEDTVTPDVGAALRVADVPTEMSILIGTDAVDCGTDLDTFFEKGTFVQFDVDNTAPATHADASISVIKITARSFSLNGASGTVVIDSIGADRVTGSVTFSTTDDEVGTITAMGTFDIIRCF